MARPAWIRRFIRMSWVTTLVLGCSSGDGAPTRPDLSALDPTAAELLRSIEEAARVDATDAAAHGRLGLAYEAYGLLDSARAAYDRAATLDPDEPRWHYHLARMIAATGDLEAGLAKLDRTIELAPDYAPAHWRAGQWLLDLGEPLAAEVAFRHALTLDPAALPAQVGLARVCLETDRPGAALEVLLAALQAGRAGPDAEAYLHQLLGAAYRGLGRLDEAATALARARPVIPAWPDPWRDEQLAYRTGFAADLQGAMNVLADGGPARAIPLLERLRQERPEDVTLLSNLGAAYLDVGRVSEGKQALLTALGIQPEHFGSHLNLSAVFEREGRADLALEHADRAIAANPFLGRAHEQRAGLLFRQGRFADALAAFETARGLEPGRTEVLLGAGLARSALGEYEAASVDLQAVVDRQPADLRAWLGLAHARLETGDTRGARLAIDAAATLSPDHADLGPLRRRAAALAAERN